MGGGQEVLGRVTTRRTVTASDVAARHTKAQMDPVPPATGEAIGASVRCGCDRPGQPHMGTWGHLVSRDRGLLPSAWALGLFGAPRARVERRGWIPCISLGGGGGGEFVPIRPRPRRCDPSDRYGNSFGWTPPARVSKAARPSPTPSDQGCGHRWTGRPPGERWVGH
jgi:hypothetical protein